MTTHLTPQSPDFSALSKQLETCRAALPKLCRGKGPLQLFSYEGRVYPLLETLEEYEWFCSHTGIAAYRGKFFELDDVPPDARAFCANPACENSVQAGARERQCPGCGGAEVMLLSDIAMFSGGRPGPSHAPSLVPPLEFRGVPVTGWAIAWGAAAGFAGYALNQAVGAAAALAAYGVLRAAGSITRGGIRVDNDGITFRSRSFLKASSFPYRDIQLLKVDHVVVRGALFLPVNQYGRFRLYDAHGKLIHHYNGERFGQHDEAAVIRAVHRAAPHIRILAPGIPWE
jgi:hypothetical protein